MAEDQKENTTPLLIAVVSSLACLLALFLVTRPIVHVLHSPWSEWLLALTFPSVPIAFTFLILYRSAWHEEWFGFKRLLLSIVASCLIFGFNLFLLAMIAALGAFCSRFLAGH